MNDFIRHTLGYIFVTSVLFMNLLYFHFFSKWDWAGLYEDQEKRDLFLYTSSINSVY